MQFIKAIIKCSLVIFAAGQANAFDEYDENYNAAKNSSGYLVDDDPAMDLDDKNDIMEKVDEEAAKFYDARLQNEPVDDSQLIELIKECTAKEAIFTKEERKSLYSFFFDLCFEGYLDAIRYLIEEHEINPNVVDQDEIYLGWTPLMWAVDQGYKDVAEYLVGLNVNLGAKNCEGDTAFDIALRKGKKSIIALFIRSIENVLVYFKNGQ